MNYDGPSIGLEGEQNRQQAIHQHSRSSAWSNMRFERAIVRRFTSKGNVAEVETDDGELYPQINVQTPLELILLLYGEVDKLFDIPCLIMYRSVPEDGFVILGDLTFKEEKKGSRVVNQPFYL